MGGAVSAEIKSGCDAAVTAEGADSERARDGAPRRAERMSPCPASLGSLNVDEATVDAVPGRGVGRSPSGGLVADC